MKLSEMSKEQKQYVVLGLIVGCTTLFAAFQFVVIPAAGRWSRARSDLSTLQADLDDAERIIKGEEKLIALRVESDADLARSLSQYLPAANNPLSWATQNLYRQAREVGVELQSISETNARGVMDKLADDGVRSFQSYAVRLAVECTYQDVKAFVAALESENPYVTITGLSIDAKSDRPLHHSVVIDVEWPMAAKPIQVPEGGPQHG